MAKRKGFLSRLFGRAKRYLTEEKTVARTTFRGGRQPEPQISDEELGQIIEYAETGEWPEEEVPVYEVEELETVEIAPRSFIPGPDPSRLRSGDLLATAQFYGVTDDEYEHLEQLIDTAYVNPAASEAEKRAAQSEIQDAMSMLHARARETEDFDWARWREEVYGGRR